MATNYSPKVITNGLIFTIDAGNIKSYPGSGTSVFDLTNTLTGGSLINGTTVSSDSFVFDGANDQLSFNTASISLVNGYTAIMIANWTTFSGGSFQLLNNVFNTYINFYNGNSNKLRWETYVGNSITSVTSLTTGKNTFVAGTFSGTTTLNGPGSASIYINGVLDKTSALNSGPSVTGSLILGQYAGAMNGKISYFAFYNKELSAKEIEQNYNVLRSRFGI